VGAEITDPTLLAQLNGQTDYFARNSAYAKPAPVNGYLTQLPAQEEASFQSWVKQNKVPFDSSSTADYDMRGFYKGLMSGDPHAQSSVDPNDQKLHYSDYWKTPYHQTFSAESQWATQGAPRWNRQDQLVLPNGQVVFDDKASGQEVTDPALLAQLNGTPAQTAPTQSPNALGPWASSIVRPVAKAVASIPLMAGDAGITLGNMVRPTIDRALGLKQVPNLPLTLPAFNRLLDKYTTQPQGFTNKAAEFVSTALAGSRIPLPGIKNPAPAGFTRPGAASALTGAQQQAMQQGADLGMQVTPGQQMGSRALQQVEAKLESQPWTSGPFNALKTGNQSVLDRTAAQAIGETAPTVDASVLGRANERLGAVFESVRTPTKQLLVDPKTTENALKQIDSTFEGLLPNEGSIVDNKLVARLAQLTSEGKVNGEQLGSLSSKLGKVAYKQMTGAAGDRDLGQALYAVKDHVDDLVQQTLSGDELAAYTAARSQYRALMQLTSRVGTVNPSTGHVGAGALANYLQQTDRQGFLYGKNQTPLYNAARFAQAFKPVVGDSGTATRLPNLFNPLELATGIPANLLSRLYLSGPGRGLLQAGAQTPNLLQGAHPLALGGLLAAPSLQAGQ
jgi:translation initiation factor 6 (eIF-6)